MQSAETARDTARFREVFGRFATGVAVVTATAAEGTGGMTANAVCSLSLDPMLVLVCFEQEARTLPLVHATGRFAVNVLRDDGARLARRFASKIPEGDKLDGVPWRDEAGAPVLEDAVAWAVCDLRDVLPGGDHAIVIGEVRALGDAEGDPLLWYRGAYRGLSG